MSNEPLLAEDQLTQELASLPGWELRDNWIRRTFETPGFAHTLLLANTIAYLAEAAWHHPDLVLGYAQLTVKLQTHRVHGITRSDIELARKIDEVVLWKGDGGALPGYPKKWIK